MKISGSETPANGLNYAFVTKGMRSSTGSAIFFGLPIFPGSLIFRPLVDGNGHSEYVINGFAFSIHVYMYSMLFLSRP